MGTCDRSLDSSVDNTRDSTVPNTGPDTRPNAKPGTRPVDKPSRAPVGRYPVVNTALPRHTRRRVAVVGGGWAGLSAAVRAASDGHHVTVFEASRHWGGRARSLAVELPDGSTAVLDNGQHILIGAYTDTLRLMRHVGVDTQATLLRVPLGLVYPDGAGLQLPNWGMPTDAVAGASTHVSPHATTEPHRSFGLAAWLSHRLALAVVAGVCQARGWSWRDKLALLATATRWQLTGFTCGPTTTVAQLCATLPSALQTGFINPLCVSALNTPANQASGQVFLRVLKDALFGVPGGADLLLPKADMGSLFPLPAVQWLMAHPRGADMRLGARVTDIRPAMTATETATLAICEGMRTCTDIDIDLGVRASPLVAPHAPGQPISSPPGTHGWLVNGEHFDHVVLAYSSSKMALPLYGVGLSATYSENSTDQATNPHTGAMPSPLDWVAASNNLRFEAIATVYAWCGCPGHPASAHVLPRPMTTLRHTPHQPAQFVFDRSWLNGPKGLLAFVVSASEADAQTLQTQVCAQAQAQLGLRVVPLKTVVEKRATFACTPDLTRPHAHIATNLTAAGDHITGPYPATLEGAVRSGWYAGQLGGNA